MDIHFLEVNKLYLLVFLSKGLRIDLSTRMAEGVQIPDLYQGAATAAWNKRRSLVALTKR